MRCILRYKVIEARKDGTKFTNRDLENAAERLGAVSGQYEDLQKELVEQVGEGGGTGGHGRERGRRKG